MMTADHAPHIVEDHVVVYSAAEERYCAGLLDGFRARHPGIAVRFVFGISVALHERYLAEVAAESPTADVMWSSAMDLQMDLVRSGHALPHDSAEAARLPAGCATGNLAYATTVEPLVTLVNRDLLDPRTPAGSIAEIAEAIHRDPLRLRGRVAAYDIERNGLGFLALLQESRDDAAFEAFLEALAACRPRTFGSNPQLVEEVASGRAALAYHVLASYAARAVRAHPALAVAPSGTARLAVSRVAFIPRRAPHPSAARRFVNYLLSPDGQRRLGEAGLHPVLAQGEDDEAGLGPLAPIRIDRDFEALLDPARHNRLLQRWRRVAAATTQGENA
jgi:iron(III) transport system substrate-binding protein